MAFIITVTSGVAIGFIYDFFRVMLNNSTKNKAKYAVADIIFWIMAGIVIAYSFYYSDNMNLRAYQFLGVLSGLCLYFLFFSKLFSSFHLGIYKIIKFFFKILFTIAKFFAIIITSVFKWGSYPFIKLFKFSKRLSKFFKNKFEVNVRLMRKV